MNPQESGAPEERPFCHATGFVFQIVGFLLTLGTCCWWSLSGWTMPAGFIAAARNGRPMVMSDSGPPIASQFLLVAVCLSLVGGLALIALGIGLQNDLLRSGRLPLWTCGVVAFFFWAYLGLAVAKFPATGRIITAGIMALGWTALFLLAGASREELNRTGPPRRESSWTSRDEDDLRRASSLPPPDEMNR